MFRILVADKLGQAGLERLEQAEDATHDLKAGLGKEELLSVIPDYDALIVRSATEADADVLKAGKRLRVVGRAGIGVDNIDVKAATARGIIVMNTPQANTIATCEHTMAMMLAVSRHTAAAHASVQAGEWERSRFTGWQLYRRTLGLIGLGRIGRLVATRAQSFGMEVVAFDPYVTEEVAQEIGVTLVDLDDLLAKADFISLHTGISPETRHIINAESIERMKDGVVIVNCARGGLVDEQALAAALDAGKVKAAAVDVYGEEPPPADHPLLGRANVLTTPHLGASTAEAQRDVAVQIVDQVLDALRNRDFRNSINMPFAAGPEFESVMPYMVLAEKIGVLQFTMAEAPIRRVELELKGEAVEALARPVAAALLKGIMSGFLAEESVNYISAPVLAEEHGLTISQTRGLSSADYTNVVACRVYWGDNESSSRVITGALFSGRHPRIVQVSRYHLDVDPSGTLLIMLNKDVPGVIGQVGTILGVYGVNVGEWRMGRDEPGEQALSFINLDSEPPQAAMDSLSQVSAITKLKLLHL